MYTTVSQATAVLDPKFSFKVQLNVPVIRVISAWFSLCPGR